MNAATVTSAGSAGPAIALALLLVMLPLIMGVALGRRLGRRRWGVATATLAVSAFTFAGLEGFQEVGAWDTISIGALLLTGLLLGAAHIERRSAVALLLSSLLALAGLEVASRLWLPQPPSFPKPETAIPQANLAPNLTKT